MAYKEQERKKAIRLRNEIFRDQGYGVYKKQKREFVLAEPQLNLWHGIKEDALHYYKENQITWWDSGDKPTGHLLSSQIACINHLFFIRQRSDLSTVVLRAIYPQIYKALVIDSGFVEFEKVGKEKLGGEERVTRGANCTSIDALMLGETVHGKRILFLIEWKYTESYATEAKFEGESGEKRLKAYGKLLESQGCPINCTDIKHLFYEPFYQLMRQTLLGWQMSLRREYGAEDWVHIHVIPNENKELRETVTSPGLKGRNIEQAWKEVLIHPDKYLSIDPKDFLEPISNRPDTKTILTYLEKRYWGNK